MRASAKSVCGDHIGALELAEASLKANPRHVSTLRIKAISLSLLGEREKAAIAADELMRWDPGLSIRSYLENHPAGGHRETPQMWASALREAGVPLG